MKDFLYVTAIVAAGILLFCIEILAYVATFLCIFWMIAQFAHK